MRVKVRSVWKKIITALSNKTKDLRIRIMIFFLLHKNNIDKTTLTHSLRALVSQPLSSSHHHSRHRDDENRLPDIVVVEEVEEEENNRELEATRSLTHELFKESEAELEAEAEVVVGVEEEVVHGGDAVEGVAEVEDDEDIDEAADLFIQKFKRNILLQKQLSLDKNHGVLVSNASN